MDLNQVRAYCLSKAGVTESLPFDDKTLVFKVGNKIFCLFGTSSDSPAINLKCDPEEALFLRDLHPEVIPGYHMNKKHWNTTSLAGQLADEEILRQIDNSYNLIYNSLPNRIKIELS